MKRLAVLLSLCAALLLVVPVPVQAATQVRTLVEDVLTSQLQQAGEENVEDFVVHVLPQRAGVDGEWLAITLSQYGEYDFAPYVSALEQYIKEENTASATSRERLALAFLACGYDSAFLDTVLDESAGQQGVMSWVFALHLLRNGAPSQRFAAQQVLAELLGRQLADGGWAVSGEVGDVDVTAMVLQALAPWQQEDAAVAQAVERALALLAERQLPNGGYQSYGLETAESAAQVITALCALGIDCRKDERFLKEGGSALDALLRCRTAAGDFAHVPGGESHAMATTQSLYALVSLWRLEQGKGGLYELDHAPLLREIPRGSSVNGRTVAVGVLAAVFVLLCAWLWLSHRRRGKNFLFLAALFLLALWGVLRVEIRAPEEYYGSASQGAMETSLSIRCDTVAGERADIPADGAILPETVVRLSPGASAYDQLVAAVREYSIHMESETDAFGSRYISGLGYIYEQEFGELSGWMYRVNGQSAQVGCSSYVLEPGDRVEWVYTRELGMDVGMGRTVE